MAEFSDQLVSINDQLNRASDEIIKKIKELRTRDYMTDEDKTTLEHLQRGAETLLDIVPEDVISQAKEFEKESSRPKKKTAAKSTSKTTKDEE